MNEGFPSKSKRTPEGVAPEVRAQALETLRRELRASEDASPERLVELAKEQDTDWQADLADVIKAASEEEQKLN